MAGSYALHAAQHEKNFKRPIKKTIKKTHYNMSKKELLQVIKELEKDKGDQEDQIQALVNEAMCVFRVWCVCLRFLLPLGVLLGIILLLFNLFR